MPNCECFQPVYPFRATLRTDTSTDDNPAESFEDTTTGVPVKITPTSGQETYRGRQLEAKVDYVVETPYRSGVEPKQRLAMTGGIYDGRLLNISQVHPIHIPGQSPKLELYCTELVT